MMTIEEFDSLGVGDQIKTVPLFPALAEDEVVLRVATKKSDEADFVITYFGVTLGRWTAKKSKGALSWAFM